MAYRRANLEHAAASEANLLQGAVLIVLLALPMLAMTQPDLAIFGLHPISVLMIAAYLFGLRLMGQARDQEGKEEQSSDRAQAPHHTVRDVCVACHIGRRCRLDSGPSSDLDFGACRFRRDGGWRRVDGNHYVAAETGDRRCRGALALAVGDILGGNAFDVLFLSASDAAFPGGSIYAAISVTEVFWVALTIALVGVLLVGLLRREKHGIGNIGFESALVLVAPLGSRPGAWFLAAASPRARCDGCEAAILQMGIHR